MLLPLTLILAIIAGIVATPNIAFGLLLALIVTLCLVNYADAPVELQGYIKVGGNLRRLAEIMLAILLVIIVLYSFYVIVDAIVKGV